MFTRDEMYQAEKARQDKSKAIGVNRRIALGFLTKSYDQLKADMAEDEELTTAMMDAVDSLTWSKETSEADAQIYQSAMARIFLVIGDVVKEGEE